MTPYYEYADLRRRRAIASSLVPTPRFVSKAEMERMRNRQQLYLMELTPPERRRHFERTAARRATAAAKTRRPAR